MFTQVADSAAEAASSWSRPLNAKETIVTASTLGTSFVLINQWATGVQLGAFKESISAELKTELGAVRNDVKGDLGSMRNELKTELGAMRNEMNEVKAELGAIKRAGKH
ncbi:hypothetical protein HYH03_004898 [Edaphochlamys debaryana]|uniref:Uncharacterized protein n=1 Tax=Edaphochlamys debaryana TaxID=47281 RepID=A0A835YEH7_9CHLO|nr:hypothetical protein HYH03_004898 [Edaphochlamys debaryana]|eukprot:KAG2497315.1 hypothetical protein HYH03_004898 [Edaphochlamys debaryana]